MSKLNIEDVYKRQVLGIIINFKPFINKSNINININDSIFGT